MELPTQVQLMLENIIYRKLFLNEDPSPEFIIRLSRYYNQTQMRLMTYFDTDLGDMNEELSNIINQLYGQSYSGLYGEEEKEHDQVVQQLRASAMSEYLYSRQHLYRESPEHQLSNLSEINPPVLRTSSLSRPRKKQRFKD